MNTLEPEDIKFKFFSSMQLKTHHNTKFINDEFGIELEVITSIKEFGDLGKPKKYYYITGQEKEYTDLQLLCNDWNEIKNFDDPNNEIKWVKVIKSK